MNVQRDSGDFNNHNRRRERGRHLRHGFTYLFFVICCCIAILVISYLARELSFPMDDIQPIVSESPGVVISTDFFTDPVGDMHEDHPKSDPADDSRMNADGTAWYLILVNRWNPIPDDYKIELTELSNGQKVDKRIYPALQDMFDAARSEGIYPVVASGYRTAETQQRIMDEKVVEYIAAGSTDAEAAAKAEAWVAIPGTSEHQIGMAVDINADGIHSAGYEVYEWLAQNAYKYGFICRYPADKTEITGVAGEAWHYRYVGQDAAERITEQGVCLEEYLKGAN